MSFVGMPGRVPGGYAQAFHISMWITCGFPHGFPQNVDNRENLWITFLIQRPYDNKKESDFQELFGAEFSGKNAGYPQVGCFLRGSYPQYPVVCGQVRHKFSRRHAAFPSFLRQNVWNCAQRFFGENFAQREMHRKKGKMWRSGTQKRGCQGFSTDSPLLCGFSGGKRAASSGRVTAVIVAFGSSPACGFWIHMGTAVPIPLPGVLPQTPQGA